MSKTKLRIIHETNPKKYFPALYELANDGTLELVGTHRYSVLKEWMRSWLRDKTDFKTRTLNAVGDLLLRFKVPFLKGETIVIGFAPWDWRLLIYRGLAKKNSILYQTSWHDWRLNSTPRQPKPEWFKRYLQKQWHAFVRHPNVKVIAVTPVVAETVKQETGINATVIPHAVPEVFFAAGRARMPHNEKHLKLLYVGEISEKKGIKLLLELATKLKNNLTLTVVGNGPLANEVQNSSSNVTYLGPIYDREKLAQVMAEHDVLMLLSQRTPTWEELFGIVIVEAIAAGCVVIASDHIGPKGILGTQPNNGLVEEGNEQAIKDYLNSFIKDNQALAGLKVRQNVANNYSTQAIKNNWFKAIQTI